jgi:SDR family mycofactocin-dependent oxidoreductase
VDICAQIDTVPYQLATAADLKETATEVEARGRRIVASETDVRSLEDMQAAVREGVAQLGRLDIVVANAGISLLGRERDPVQDWQDVIDVNLTGVWNTLRATVPVLVDQGEGGSVVITSSTAGLKGLIGGLAGSDAYAAAKHGVVGLMRSSAKNLAGHGIRVNSVHPTGVRTPMVENDVMSEFLALAPERGDNLANLMPVELIEPIDVANAVVWLVSDDARYVTGVTLPVDAGYTVK